MEVTYIEQFIKDVFIKLQKISELFAIAKKADAPKYLSDLAAPSRYVICMHTHFLLLELPTFR